MNLLALLLDSAFKSSILLMVAFMATLCLRRQSASVRHMVWSAAIVASVLLPVLTLAIPSFESGALEPVAAFLSPVSQVTALPQAGGSFTVNASTSAGPAFNLGQVVLPVLILGVAVGLVMLGAASFRLMSVASRAQPFHDQRWLFESTQLSRRFGLRRTVRLLQHRSASMLVTWGVFTAKVLLPSDVEQWPDHRVRAVLGHELAHVSRHDWFVQLFAEAARIIYWFNPLMWGACNRLREEGERACDDAVLNLGVDETEYAANLLAVARALKHSRLTWTPALGMARPSNLERRFSAMLNRSLDRRSATRKAVLLTALATVVMLLPLSVLKSPAQILGGRFVGTITDTSGSPVPNVTVIVSNAQAGMRFMTTTSATGGFEFPSLPTGQFKVEMLSARGFERPATSITMQVSQNLRQDFQMTRTSTANQPRLMPPPPPASPMPGAEPQGRVIRNTGMPPPPPPPPPQRIRQGGNVSAAMLLQQTTPVYPEAAKAAGIEGTIILEAVIGKTGQVISVKVINTDSDPTLAKAAVECVSQWIYRQTRLNDVPVEVVTTVSVNFTAPQ